MYSRDFARNGAFFPLGRASFDACGSPWRMWRTSWWSPFCSCSSSLWWACSCSMGSSITVPTHPSLPKTPASRWICYRSKPFHSQIQKVHSPNLLKKKCISDVVRLGSIIIFHLSKLSKAKFFTLCDAIFLVRLQGEFEVDHSWEWKGKSISPSLQNSGTNII